MLVHTLEKGIDLPPNILRRELLDCSFEGRFVVVAIIVHLRWCRGLQQAFDTIKIVLRLTDQLA